MKRSIQMFLIALMVIIAVGSCKPQKGCKAYAIYMLDISDSSLDTKDVVQPQGAVDIILGKNFLGFGKISVQLMNCLGTNTHEDIVLPEPTEGINPMDITIRQDAFDSTVKAVLPKMLSKPTGDVHSRLAEPIAEAIKKLHNSDACVKVLVVVSDMVEFTPECDFYHMRIGKTPVSIDSMSNYLDHKLGLPEDCSDVKVVVVFSAAKYKVNREAVDRDHKSAMEVWDPIFTRHHIDCQKETNY